MILIGITGKARAGKDTVASMIAGTAWDRRAWFATPIKRGVKAIFGWGDEMLEGETKEQMLLLGFSPRIAMQRLGTEWGRGLNDGIWVSIAAKEFHEERAKVMSALHRYAGEHGEHTLTPHYYVLGDCRFNNEARWIKSQGGFIIKVNRGVEPVAMHSSESGIDRSLVDYEIDNNSTLECLRNDVSAILGHIVNICSQRPVHS